MAIPSSRTTCAWTRGLSTLEVPARHGEGKFVLASEKALDQRVRPRADRADHGRGLDAPAAFGQLDRGTLAAAIAANLALSHERRLAVRQAKEYVTTALKHALSIGKGQGPVGHFVPLLNNS